MVTLQNISPEMAAQALASGGVAAAEPGEYRSFAEVFEGLNRENTAPYGHLADENGMICWNGIVLQCDEEKNALCLGDMSQPQNVLSIPLSGGGVFRVNRDNFGDVSKIIGMFSPEDARRIMEAISTDLRAQEKQMEVEELEDGLFAGSTQAVREAH